MRIDELQVALDNRGVNRASYQLRGSGDGYALMHQGRNWIVAVYERGEELERHVFASEEDACAFFLPFITKDRGVFKSGQRAD